MGYRIMVVEDEEIVRSSVVQTLREWDEFELELAEASDGFEGVITAQSFVPQIIITDIKMPGLDGLKMLAKIKETQPGVKCLILSGYNDFEFARGAIELNVSSYLLKPFDDDELFEKLRKLIGAIGEASDGEGSVAKRRDLQAARSNMVKNLLSMTWNEDMSKILKSYGITLDCAHYVCIDVLMCGLGAQELAAAAKLACRFLGDERAFRELFPAVYEMDSEIVLLLGSDGMIEPFGLIRLCDRLRVQLKRRFKTPVLVGIGRETDSPRGLNRSFAESWQALAAGFFAKNGAGEKPVIFSDMLYSEERYNAVKQRLFTGLSQIYSSIIAAVMNGRTKEACRLLDQMQSTMRAYPEMGLHTAMSECDRLCSMLCRCVDEYHDRDMSEREERTRGQMRKCADLAGVFAVLAQTVADIDRQISGNGEGTSAVVEKLKRLIEKNYGTGITLAEAAGQLGFSPNYLGALFTRTTGKSFNAYLAEYRIEQGKRLLRQTDMKVKAVAESVGISDVTYFSTLFRNITGMTPSAYRKM